MRAIFVLAAILSLAVPEVSAREIELRSPISVQLSVASPAYAALPQMHRLSSKAEKAIGFGGAIGPDLGTILLPLICRQAGSVSETDPPNVNLHQPPLAPRPPPQLS
jgi:hypothetical protein